VIDAMQDRLDRRPDAMRTCERPLLGSRRATLYDVVGVNTRAILALTHIWWWPRLISADYPGLEQIELSATIHLALHELELCYLTFGLAI
jgi:hypothetical protein